MCATMDGQMMVQMLHANNQVMPIVRGVCTYIIRSYTLHHIEIYTPGSNVCAFHTNFFCACKLIKTVPNLICYTKMYIAIIDTTVGVYL